MTKERQEALCTLSAALMSEVCDSFEAEGGDQAHFLSVDSRTNETVVTVVAQGDAADLLLEYLDYHKRHEVPHVSGEVIL